jgi:uncharacterized membrane protein
VVIVIGIPVATDVWRRKFEGGFPGGPPAIFGLLLAGISLAALRGRGDELRPDAARGRSGTTVAGLHGPALVAFLLAVALALQLEREAPPFAFAAAALAAALIWKRTDQLSLKYVSAVLASLTTLALVLGVLDSSFETQSFPIANDHAFDVLLPGLLLLGVALCVMPAELSRVRDGERGLYSTRPVPIVASLAGLCGLFVVFLWMNVEVQNHFADGKRFRLAFGSDAARDLSLSIAWAVYALALLFLGMARKSGLLRWVSLILLLSTIAKVFLLDLEDLRGLYRAGSFLGLALSLLAVSWVYQRFVFRKPRPSPS